MSYVRFDNYTTNANNITILSLGTFEDVITYDRLRTAHNESLSFNRFSNRQRSVSMSFENVAGFRIFKKSVLKTHEQTIVFGDDDSISHVGHVVSLQRNQLNMTAFEYIVTIELYPFGYLKERTVTLTTSGTVQNNGDTTCEPRIILNGNGTCRLVVGNTVCNLTIDTQLTIECDKTKANVYDKYGNLANSRMKGDFPALQAGINGVTLQNITSAEFIMKERVL